MNPFVNAKANEVGERVRTILEMRMMNTSSAMTRGKMLGIQSENGSVIEGAEPDLLVHAQKTELCLGATI